jgi:hypothetical protein
MARGFLARARSAVVVVVRESARARVTSLSAVIAGGARVVGAK